MRAKTARTANTTRATFAAVVAPGIGAISNVTVLVDFIDQYDSTSQPVHRTVTLTRRINHG